MSERKVITHRQGNAALYKEEGGYSILLNFVTNDGIWDTGQGLTETSASILSKRSKSAEFAYYRDLDAYGKDAMLGKITIANIASDYLVANLYVSEKRKKDSNSLNQIYLVRCLMKACSTAQSINALGKPKCGKGIDYSKISFLIQKEQLKEFGCDVSFIENQLIRYIVSKGYPLLVFHNEQL